MHLVVDAMNVIGSRPDGWWRDRRSARRRLAAQLVLLAATGYEVTVVFDGRAAAGEVDGSSAGGVTEVFAPGGPDAADRAIVRLVSEIAPSPDVRVVTSDGNLAAQVRRMGVEVEGAGTFRARLDSLS